MSIIIHTLKNESETDKIMAFFALASETGQPVGNTIQILPYGWVETAKGKFLVDDAAMKMIMQDFTAKKNDTVIDYEHQTLKDVIAPAAAWIKKLENRGKDGLWAEVEWTTKAQEFLQNKEYRYLSPVIFARKSDNRAAVLHSCGLTNTPAIDGMAPIVNKETEAINMDLLKMLAVLLGLPETATEEEIKTAVQELKNKAEQSGQMVANKEILSLLELPETVSLSDAKGKIIALKNPSGYVSAQEFKSLQDKLAAKDRDELVMMAMKSGKVAPSQKVWAEEYALKDPEGFKAFLKNAPAVVPVDTEFAGDDPKRKHEADEMQLAVNKSLGISEESFKKFGGEA